MLFMEDENWLEPEEVIEVTETDLSKMRITDIENVEYAMEDDTYKGGDDNGSENC